MNLEASHGLLEYPTNALLLCSLVGMRYLACGSAAMCLTLSTADATRFRQARRTQDF